MTEAIIEATGEVRSLFSSIHDSATVLTMRGWAGLEIKVRLGPTSDIEDLKLGYRMKGTTPPSPPANGAFGIDVSDEFATLGATVVELVRRSCPGERMNEVRLTCTREPESTSWTLLDGSNRARLRCRFNREELDLLLFSDALLEALTERKDDIAAGQANLEAEVGPFVAHESRSDERLLLFHYEDESRRIYRVEHLGTYVRGADAWAWAWSIPQTGPEGCPGILGACRPEAREDRVAALWQPRFEAPLGFVMTIARLAAHRAGALGTFVAEYDDHSRCVLFALFEELADDEADGPTAYSPGLGGS